MTQEILIALITVAGTALSAFFGVEPLKAGANIGTLTTNVVSYPTSRTILTAPARTWTVADLTTTDYLQASVRTTRLWALSNATVFIDDLYYTIEYTTSSGITTQVNINGIWKDINCAVNIGGVWKPVTSIKKKNRWSLEVI